MQPLHYSINVTLDGCVDHRAGIPNEGIHHHAVENFARADALLFGRVIYEMMEEAWRPAAQRETRPAWVTDWMLPFAHAIDRAKKYVVSSTLAKVDWNAELVRGDLGAAVSALKEKHGEIALGGVKLPLALAELGLIDSYEFVVHPVVAGHGPTLFAGLSKRLMLTLERQVDLGDGIVARRYVPGKQP